MNSKMDTASSNPKFNWDSADLVGEWKAFRQHVEFMFKGPLRAKNEEERCCYLMLWVGEKGRRIFSTWDMTDAQQKVLQEYYDRFQAYVQPKSNPIFARYKLHSKIQEPGETVQQFVTALKLLVKAASMDKQKMTLCETESCLAQNPPKCVRSSLTLVQI